MADKAGGTSPIAVEGTTTEGQRVLVLVPDQGIRAEDTVSWLDAWSTIWSGRWIVAACVALFFVGSLGYVLLAPSWYRAEVVLVPAKEKSVSSIDSPLGGLAALAGVSVGNAGKTEPLAVIRSRDMAREFIESHQLVPIIFADKWDRQAGAWKSLGGDEPPDIRDAVEYFRRKVIEVAEDRRTGIVSVIVEWKDPVLAAKWVTEYVAMANSRMRKAAVAEASGNIEYLNAELDRATVVALQQSISRLIETEMQKLMLARGSEHYAFRVVDSAQVPKKPVRPRRILVVMVAALSGAALAAMGLVLFSLLGRENMH